MRAADNMHLNLKIHTRYVGHDLVRQYVIARDLQIMENSGLEAAGFHGVPVFQATGLTVKTENSRRTPLFFDKRDLDAAVSNAYSQKISQRQQATRAKVDRAHQDLVDANKQVPA